MNKILPVTIVCPTHNGAKRLPLLLNSILKNTHLPKQIIICGTSLSDFKFLNSPKYKKLNIKKIVSKIKNQKYQRDLAIKNVNTNIIAQCDDDLELEINYIKKSYDHFRYKKNSKKIVSAAILFKNYQHQAIRWNTVFYNSRIYKYILLLFNMGNRLQYMSVLSSGRIIPLLPKDFLLKNNKSKILNNLQWVCSTIIYTKSAIKDAFYYLPEIGKKSYFEDVFFSHSLFLKNYDLIIDRSIIAYHPMTEKTNLSIYLKTIKSQSKIVKTFKKSKIMFYLDVFVFLIIFILLKIFK